MRYELLHHDVKPCEFDCGVDSINEYVYQSYLATLLQHGYAYQIVHKNKILGYYMLTINHVLLEDCPEEISEYTSGLSEYLYTVEIKYLAIHKNFQHKGVGTQILKSIIKIIKDLMKYLPFRLITIDARDDYVKWYEKMGFVKFPINSAGQDVYTTKMYIDCMQNQKELNEYEKTLY